MNNDARNRALAFLNAHSVGIISSVDRENQPHGSAVYYRADEKFNIYFLTLLNSRKYAAMTAHPRIAFTVLGDDLPQTMQIEGSVIEITNDEEKSEHIPKLVEILRADPKYPAPIMRLPESETVLMWLRPSWVRFADYSASDTDAVLTEIPLA